jgi:hypothetical protein
MKISTIFRFSMLLAPLAAFSMLYSCATPPNYPIEPYIEYLGMSKDTLRRGAMQEDTTFVTFSFTDGDGDIGNKDTIDLFVTDLRTGVTESQFRVPEVPELGASNGIKGEITFRLFTTCCIFPPDLGLDPCNGTSPQFRYDKVVYEFYLRDRAGHESNRVQTDTVYIRCFN